MTDTVLGPHSSWTRLEVVLRPLSNNEEPNWYDVGTVVYAGLILHAIILFFPLLYAIVLVVSARTKHNVESQSYQDANEATDELRALFTIESAMDILDRARLRSASTRTVKDSPGQNYSLKDLLGRWTVLRYYVEQRDSSLFRESRRILAILLNATVIVGYTISSFQRRIGTWIAIVNLVSGIIFLIDFLFKMFWLPYPSTWNVFRYLFGSRVLVESLSIPSVLLAGTGRISFVNFNFIRVIPLYQNILSVCYPTGSTDSEPDEGSNPKAYFASWLAFLASLFFSLAGAVYMVEVLPADPSWIGDGWTVFNSMYFMIVTMTTVGYGDFSPTTYPGVVFMMFAIGYILFYIATKVSILLDVHSSTCAGKGSYEHRKHIPFVVVVGNIEFQDFVSFLDTFYTVPALANTRIVVLSRSLPWTKTDMVRLKGHAKYGRTIKVLVGTPLNPTDRKRAALQHAEAVFAFAPGSHADDVGQDARNVLRAVALRDRIRAPIYAAHIAPGTFIHMQRAISGVKGSAVSGDAICQRDLWASFVSLNIRCPGSSTLIANLYNEWETALQETDLPWLREYKLGASNSLTALIVADPENLSLHDFTRTVYTTFGALIVAVIDGTSRKMLSASLEPDIRVTPNSVAFLLANESKMRSLRNSGVFLPVDLVARFRQKGALTGSKSRNNSREAESLDDSSLSQDLSSRPKQAATGVPDSELEGHVIITGYTADSVQDAKLIVAKLAAQYCNRRDTHVIDDIIVLLPDLAVEVISKFQSAFPHVRLRTGSALKVEDLTRVGIQRAASLIVLLEVANPEFKGSVNFDSRPVFTMLLVDQIMEQCRDDLNVMTFIRDTEVAGVLRVPHPRRVTSMLGVPQQRPAKATVNPDDRFCPIPKGLKTVSTIGFDPRSLLLEDIFVRPRFAAGEIVVASLTASFLAKEYQIPGAVRILRLLTDTGAEGGGARLHLLGVPGSWAGWRYARVFEELLRRRALPLGLLRSGRGPMRMLPVATLEESNPWRLRADPDTESGGAEDSDGDPRGSIKVNGGANALPWVYTNPESHTVVLDSDAIFVFATIKVFQELLSLHE